MDAGDVGEVGELTECEYDEGGDMKLGSSEEPNARTLLLEACPGFSDSTTWSTQQISASKASAPKRRDLLTAQGLHGGSCFATSRRQKIMLSTVPDNLPSMQTGHAQP